MPEFQGFTQDDFKDDVTGTKWRGQIGHDLRERLQESLGVPFQSVPIYRVPVVYLVPESYWKGVSRANQGYPRCKFRVQVSPQGLHFGFYVEKGYGRHDVAPSGRPVLDSSWDWNRFVSLVGRSNHELSLRQLMQQHPLRLVLEYSGKQGLSTRLIAVSRPDGAFEVTENDVNSVRDWSYIVDKIVQAPDDKWLDVYLEHFLPKEEAVARGSEIVEQIAGTFCALFPLLRHVAGLTSSNSDRLSSDKEGGDPVKPVKHPTVKELADYIQERFGLRFTPHQIACYITALQTKGFVILSGMSGTGKTKLAQAFAEFLRSYGEGANCLFLPVRPDWRDNKALVGYHNPILDRYESTELLRFVLEAQKAYEPTRTSRPFFVILDEMNLAHVEHYFADFLSVLESGRREDGYTQEEIRLHAFGAPVKDAEGRDIPPTLALPPNLYVVGTVNVDETTYAFSPKVLDRAFTIEFEGADLQSYPSVSGNRAATLADDQREALLTAFTRDGRFIKIEKAPAIKGSAARESEFMGRLRDLDQRLRPYDLHFGYRVVDEILAFLANAEKYGWFDENGGLGAAFDSAVLMKVLPKFHGPRARLKEPLHKVLEWTGMPDPPDESAAGPADYQKAVERVRQLVAAEPSDDSPFLCPRTALKCLRMLYHLAVTGFASFS